jgi:hypothetical protein
MCRVAANVQRYQVGCRGSTKVIVVVQVILQVQSTEQVQRCRGAEVQSRCRENSAVVQRGSRAGAEGEQTSRCRAGAEQQVHNNKLSS